MKNNMSVKKSIIIYVFFILISGSIGFLLVTVFELGAFLSMMASIIGGSLCVWLLTRKQ